MDPYDELAELIIIAYQQRRGRLPEVFESCEARLPPEWKWGTDQARRSIVRDLLYSDRDLATQFVADLPRLPLFFIYLARKVKRRPYSPPTSSWKDFLNLRQTGKKLRRRVQEWTTETPEAAGPELGHLRMLGTVQRMARALAAHPGMTARVARDLQTAVPFSVVFADELDEIARSRRSRRDRVDPEMWVSELRAARQREVDRCLELGSLREEREQSKESSSADADGAVNAVDARYQEQLRRAQGTLRQIDTELTGSREIREQWHQLRVQESRLAEILDLEPDRYRRLKRQKVPNIVAEDLHKRMQELVETLDEGDRTRSSGSLSRAAAIVSGIRNSLQAAATDRRDAYKYKGRPQPIPSGVPPPGIRESPSVRASKMETLALAFSGGGIRSATFNLGILQALSEFGLLKYVDYLSTVSGGGYVGAWLTAWCSRVPGGVRTVERRLSPTDHGDPEATDIEPIRFLREFSNYLTPRVGFFTADTWTLITVWLRNTLLNQFVLALVLASLLTLPFLLIGVVTQGTTELVAVAGVAALLAVARVAGANLRSFEERFREMYEPYTQETWVVRFAVFPVFIACFLAVMLLWWSTAPGGAYKFSPAEAGVVCAAVIWAVMSVLNFTGAYGRCYTKKEQVTHFAVGVIALTGSLASAAAGGAVFLLTDWMSEIAVWQRERWDWAVLTFGPLAGVAILSLAVVLQIALLGRKFPDERREWWSRFGAWLLIVAGGWTVVCSISVYGPLLVAKAGHGITMAGLVTWIVTTFAGVRAAGASETTGKDAKKTSSAVKEILAHTAPYIFILGLMLALSFAIHLLVLRLTYDNVLQGNLGYEMLQSILFPNGYRVPSLDTWANYHWFLIQPIAVGTDPIVRWLWLLLFLLGGVLAWRIDVNEFSMHHFYKNRLVRCYLGASRSRRRRPNAFTGFDRDDDIRLASLRRVSPEGNGLREAFPYVGPYPIINTALNITVGSRLAWQERKAESFVFTPKYSGFAENETLRDGRQPVSDTIAPVAFRPTESYGYAEDHGTETGTAVAISGAAANPNMGYHSSPVVSFLMTVFNVRLGWWMGNPRHEASYRDSSPTFGLIYLLRELTGSSSDETKFVNLSDGGHFENLGIYELVRRRCKCIIACDGEQDGDLTFAGLGNAIRKCRVDFGVNIDIHLNQIVTVPGAKGSSAHCVVGDISYPNGFTSKLIYLKASVTGDEPADVLEYRSRSDAFPHQSTGDQWFDESQFESYRTLGYHIAKATFGRTMRQGGAQDLTGFMSELQSQWVPPTPAAQESFVRMTGQYERVLSTFRTDEQVHKLGSALFPSAGKVDPSNRFMLLSLLQLMENVFVELKLEQEGNHPLNVGWIRLFREWAANEELRSVWIDNRHTFSERFRLFCRYEVKLEG